MTMYLASGSTLKYQDAHDVFLPSLFYAETLEVVYDTHPREIFVAERTGWQIMYDCNGALVTHLPNTDIEIKLNAELLLLMQNCHPRATIEEIPLSLMAILDESRLPVPVVKNWALVSEAMLQQLKQTTWAQVLEESCFVSSSDVHLGDMLIHQTGPLRVCSLGAKTDRIIYTQHDNLKLGPTFSEDSTASTKLKANTFCRAAVAQYTDIELFLKYIEFFKNIKSGDIYRTLTNGSAPGLNRELVAQAILANRGPVVDMPAELPVFHDRDARYQTLCEAMVRGSYFFEFIQVISEDTLAEYFSKTSELQILTFNVSMLHVGIKDRGVSNFTSALSFKRARRKSYVKLNDATRRVYRVFEETEWDSAPSELTYAELVSFLKKLFSECLIGISSKSDFMTTTRKFNIPFNM